MGTQRVEAFLQCDHLALSGDDYAFMLVVCQKWNDRQIRSLEIGALYLISLLPCRKNVRPDDSLKGHLKRLQDLQVITVLDNGARYLEKRWLRIDIIDEKWWQQFEEQKEKAKNRDLQQSRGVQPRPAATRPGTANSRSATANGESTRPGTANSRSATAPTREHKDKKDITPKKDQYKGRPGGLHGEFSSDSRLSAETETSNPAPTPKPALVPAATMTEPETAAAVYNTLDLPPPQSQESDQRAWQRVISEMELTMPATSYHTWLHGQTEYFESTDNRFTIRTSSAHVRDWLRSRGRKTMEAALQRITGRPVEIEFLTSSQIEETEGNDCRDSVETLHEVPAGETARGVPPAQAQQRRPSPPMQSLPIGRQQAGTSVQGSETHVSSLQKAEAAEGVP